MVSSLGGASDVLSFNVSWPASKLLPVEEAYQIIVAPFNNKLDPLVHVATWYRMLVSGVDQDTHSLPSMFKKFGGYCLLGVQLTKAAKKPRWDLCLSFKSERRQNAAMHYFSAQQSVEKYRKICVLGMGKSSGGFHHLTEIGYINLIHSDHCLADELTAFHRIAPLPPWLDPTLLVFLPLSCSVGSTKVLWLLYNLLDYIRFPPDWQLCN